ncbi:MAG TPA: hypothetical protein VML54_15665 [Candidatus Limnocylindrales bacterium]|nr:hypothetical protein [Candidatus Limnocylindrales bacterium]
MTMRSNERSKTILAAALHVPPATKKLKGVCVCTSALYGNAASRMFEVVPSEGAYAYGGYPDSDALYRQRASETDRRKREAILHQIQRGPCMNACGSAPSSSTSGRAGSARGWPSPPSC